MGGGIAVTLGMALILPNGRWVQGAEREGWREGGRERGRGERERGREGKGRGGREGERKGGREQRLRHMRAD